MFESCTLILEELEIQLIYFCSLAFFFDFNVPRIIHFTFEYPFTTIRAHFWIGAWLWLIFAVVSFLDLAFGFLSTRLVMNTGVI